MTSHQKPYSILCGEDEGVVEQKFWDWYNNQANEDVIRDSLHDWILAHRAQLTTTAEQDGADQPSTATESKPEDEEKPKPESEGRSQ